MLLDLVTKSWGNIMGMDLAWCGVVAKFGCLLGVSKILGVS